MAKFKLPPISPLLGSTFATFFKTLYNGRVISGYYLKTVLTFLIILAATPFRWYESLYYYFVVRKDKKTKDPVFIIGHWRSGTTYLHQVLAEDQQMGYVTTYQTVFPHYLYSKFLFLPFMKSQMPEKRPGDNVRLVAKNPQEDEFALSNINPYTYYQFMYFPEDYRSFYHRFIRFEDKSHIVEKWKNDYCKMVKKACHNTKGQIPILKNPCNTGRVGTLLEMYPDAKFVHIIRNPIVVFLSSRKFFVELLPTLWFHPVDEQFIEDMILDVYEWLVKDWLELKKLIPEGNYVEVRFEEFEEDPIWHLKKLYEQLGIPDFQKAKPKFETYVNKMSGYRKNKYQVIDEILLNRILDRWGFAMDLWHYELPDYLEVIKKEAVPRE